MPSSGRKLIGERNLHVACGALSYSVDVYSKLLTPEAVKAISRRRLTLLSADATKEIEAVLIKMQQSSWSSCRTTSREREDCLLAFSMSIELKHLRISDKSVRTAPLPNQSSHLLSTPKRGVCVRMCWPGRVVRFLKPAIAKLACHFFMQVKCLVGPIVDPPT